MVRASVGSVPVISQKAIKAPNSHSQSNHDKNRIRTRMKRDETISICKAFGIILMVIGHANCPGPLSNFLYEFHMPLFFIAAGYFFSLKYLDDEATFVKKRIKGLYIPFLKWSVFFLVIHNLMFKLGILNEQYGNATGGVTHPYSWHQMQQNLWTMVCAMGGYDQFLNGAFWFFRGLFVASIAYLVLFKITNAIFNKTFVKHFTQNNRENNDINATADNQAKGYGTLAMPITICIIALLIEAWKTLEGLKVINLIQGGNREILGVFFFGCGFIFKQLKDKYRVTWWATILSAATVYIFSRFAPSSMGWRMDFNRFIALPLPAICGFIMTYNISHQLSKHNGLLKDFLVFCGNNTMCIFVFHIVAYKVVSLIKIWYYDLDYLQIGCHMVIHKYSDTDCFWILYSIAGVGIPLAWTWAYRKISTLIKSDIN